MIHRRQPSLHLLSMNSRFFGAAVQASTKQPTRRGISAVIVALVIWTVAMLCLCWWSGIQHDQRYYVKQWQILLAGGDPWSTTNTYGPIYTLLGYLLPFGRLAPKLLMVGALLAANAVLVVELMRARGIHPIQAIYLLAIATNVLFIGVGVIWGLNDALVAALLIASVLLRHQRKFVAAGLLIGLAALTKYYPLLLLPFFAIDDDRVRWSVIFSGLAVFCVGLAGAVGVWGQSPIDAIVHGSTRRASLLSILKAFQKVLDHEGSVRSLVQLLIRYNTMFVITGVVAVMLFSWKLRINWLEGAVLGYLVALTLYKVGHQQFFLPWLFMVASLPLLKLESSDRLAMMLLPIVLLLSLYQFFFEFGPYTCGDSCAWVRSYGGFIFFPASALTVALSAIYFSRRTPRLLGQRRGCGFSDTE